MDETGMLAAYAKRPHSPDPVSGPRHSAQKRTRIAGSRNLKKREWGLVHQHLIRRNDEKKNTVFVIHGVKHTWHNVHRKILRAATGQTEPSQASASLPPLPSYIELRSPSPERRSDLTPPEPTRVVDAPPNLKPAPQRPEEAPISRGPSNFNTSSDRQIYELYSEDEELWTEIDSLLRHLPLREFLNVFRRFNSEQREFHQFEIDIDSIRVKAEWEDSLGTFIDRFRPSIDAYELIMMLVRKGQISATRLLEAVVRRADGREVETLDWLAEDIDIGKFGTRALGAAAYGNNFEAVNMLLDVGVDINGRISGPHDIPHCSCQISVTDYAQLPRLEEKNPGAGDEMTAYLLGRGAAKSTGVDMGLMDLLRCVIRQQDRIGTKFLANVQSIVERIHGFSEVISETEPLLESCILESGFSYDSFWGGELFHVIEYLLDQGVRTSPGSPLAALIYLRGDENLIGMILAKTVNLNAYSSPFRLNEYRLGASRKQIPSKLIQSVSPLQAAALHGDEGQMYLLLEKGADINCPARGSEGVTSLQAICWLQGKSPPDHAEKMRIMKLLLDRGANVNAAPAWNLGLSALQVAAFVGDLEATRLLVSHGADVNAPACKYGGGTALALAARKGHLDVVRFLLERGAAIPPVGVKVSSFGDTYEDHKTILDLLKISTSELAARYGGNGAPSRNYNEYEVEWKDDPTYDKKD